VSGYAKEKLLWVLTIVWVFFHVDFWAWDRIDPILFGFIPYHVLYHTGLLIVGGVLIYWMVEKVMPEVPDQFFNDEEGEEMK